MWAVRECLVMFMDPLVGAAKGRSQGLSEAYQKYTSIFLGSWLDQRIKLSKFDVLVVDGPLFYLYAVLRIEPSASHILGKCSTTEL